MEQPEFQWTGFREVWYLIVFRKYVQEIDVLLTSDKSNVTLHEER